MLKIFTAANLIKVFRGLLTFLQTFLFGMFCAFAAFCLSSVIVLIIDFIFSLMGNTENLCHDYTESAFSSITDFLVNPTIDSLKPWLHSIIFQISAPSSAAVGAGLTTYVMVRDDASKTIRDAINKAIYTCDDSWDVDGFLKELTEAMKGAVDSPKQHMERAHHLVEAWAKYRLIFDSILKDHNGDFARLSALLKGDQVPNCKLKPEADGYISQEVWTILARIAKTYECRRQHIVNGVDNLLKEIGAIDKDAIIQRCQPPKINGIYRMLSISFGMTSLILLIYIIRDKFF